MSKASRGWKAVCKEDNRQMYGMLWARKDMTLASYMAMCRMDQRTYKRKNVKRVLNSIKELDEGKGIAFNPWEVE